MVQMNLIQNRNSITDVEKNLWLPKVGVGDKLGDWD